MPDLNFCPACGAKTVDQGPTRTYCTTCGEDVPTRGQIEDLRDELRQEKEDYTADSKLYLRSEEELERAKADLEKYLNAENALLGEAKAIIATILAGKVNPASPLVLKLTDLHARL